MSNLSVRFRGICCHIDPPNGEKFIKRTVLRQTRVPGNGQGNGNGNGNGNGSGHDHGHAATAAGAHDHGHDEGHGHAHLAGVGDEHIAYIECVAGDVDLEKSRGVEPSPAYQRAGDAGRYVRFELMGDIVELVGVRCSTLTTLPSYDERVPRLHKVAPGLGPVAPQLLGDPYEMDPAFVAAVFDMPGGTLYGGPPEPFATRFTGGETEWPAAKLASWVELLVEVPETPRIRLTPIKGGQPREIALKPGTRMITIGNETDASIRAVDEEDGGSHFGLYYGLAATQPKNAPQVEVFHGLSGGCSNSNYP
ncbi:MAG TPA: hypothetical protein VGF69_06225 [Thermoanaerobaculia bacterium]|jgi:hypothetical protein